MTKQEHITKTAQDHEKFVNIAEEYHARYNARVAEIQQKQKEVQEEADAIAAEAKELGRKVAESLWEDSSKELEELVEAERVARREAWARKILLDDLLKTRQQRELEEQAARARAARGEA